MQFDEVGWGSGHVFRVERRQGPVWYAKYRLPGGQQVKKRIGPAWTGRGRPRAGYLTRRGAEEWLSETLDDALRVNERVNMPHGLETNDVDPELPAMTA